MIDRLTRLCGIFFGPNAAAEWVVGSLLTRGRVPSQAIGATTTLTFDLDAAGENELTLMVEMTGAANGDLTVTVIPFRGDNTTPLNNVALQPIRSNGPLFAGGVVQYTGTYDVSGESKVRVAIRNTTAGALNLNDVTWRMSPGGAM